MTESELRGGSTPPPRLVWRYCGLAGDGRETLVAEARRLRHAVDAAEERLGPAEGHA